MSKLLIADLFCGAGGLTSGAVRALREQRLEAEFICINHWPTAIATHSLNHPQARHACLNLDTARPIELVPEGYLDLLMAAPECIHFSRARGGKPTTDQSRISAWHINRWVTELDVARILVENVAELQFWGPVDAATGVPIQSKRGLYFQAWLKSLWELGYQVDYRVLNAADFGEATTRSRLFIQARKDGLPIQWPEPTHSRTGSADMFGHLQRWRPAREVIDWSRPGASLLDRKKPLSVKTRQRIARGLLKYGGALGPAYVALLDLAQDELPNGADVGSTGEAGPFLLGQQGGGEARVAGHPMPTITGGGAIALVDPLLVEYHGTGECDPVDRPLGTLTGKAIYGLAVPLVVPYGPKAEARSVSSPLPTVLTKDRLGLCEPFLTPGFGEAPGQQPRVHPISEPDPTIAGTGHTHLVEPVLLPEANGVDPRRKVVLDGQPYLLDIRFRMLRTGELASAMGFDADGAYDFVGTVSEVTKQIGNAVSVRTATALVRASLAEQQQQRRLA